MKAGTKATLAWIGFYLLYGFTGGVIFALVGHSAIGVTLGAVIVTFFPPKVVKRLRAEAEAEAESKKDE